MALTELTDAPFTATFSGVSTMQCLGATDYTPETNPNGVTDETYGEAMAIEDGWAKFTIRQTDPTTATGIRSEIKLAADSVGTEYLYHWQTTINAGDWLTSTGQIVLAQEHNKDDIEAAVNWDIFIRDMNIYFRLPATEPPTTGSYNQIMFPIERLVFGKIYDFKVRVKYVAANTGFIQLVVNGKQMYQNWQLGTAYTGDAPYFKLGVYDAPHAADFGTKTIRHRNLKRYSGSDSIAAMFGEIPKPLMSMSVDL